MGETKPDLPDQSSPTDIPTSSSMMVDPSFVAETPPLASAQVTHHHPMEDGIQSVHTLIQLKPPDPQKLVENLGVDSMQEDNVQGVVQVLVEGAMDDLMQH